MTVLISLIDSPNEGSNEQNDINNSTRIERHTQCIREKELKPSANSYDSRYYTIENCCHNEHWNGERQERTFEVCIGNFLVIVHQYHGWNTKKVQQMDTYWQACHIGYQHQPTVRMRLIGIVFPLQYKPKDNCSECWWIGIYLTFDCREPESITESIDQCTYKTGSFDGNHLRKRWRLTVTYHQSAGKMRNGPEQKHDTRCGKQCVHGVDHTCNLWRITGKMWEKIGCKHEEWRPRRVSYLQFIACSDEFRTVPKAGCRLNRGTINECCNQESYPPEDVIHQSKLFHLCD